jgi:apolipoprotein N-acyltransferase
MNKRTPVCLVLKSAVLLVTLLCVFPLFATNPQKKEMKELELIHQNLSKYLKQDAPEIQRSSHNQLPSL